MIAGVDGCPAGWICVVKDRGSESIEAVICRRSQELLQVIERCELVAIDIPIGLSESGPRVCDQAARKILGRRRSSIFPAPIRQALDADSWEWACEITKGIDGRKVSKQAWGIYGKIKQIDVLLGNNDTLRPCLREVHPELSFTAWNGNMPLVFGKKQPQGKQERLRLISANYGHKPLEGIRATLPRKDVADDDLYDAFAALWTTERMARGEAVRIPRDPPVDAMGLNMAIWY